MRFFAFLCLFLSASSGIYSAPITVDPLEFDVKEANRTFDKINLKLSIQNLKLEDLNVAVTTLAQLTQGADDCVEVAQKKINTIDTLLKQSTETQNYTLQADHLYLDNEKKERLDTLAQCRLFSIRSNEAISAYKSAAFELKQEVTLSRGKPLWALIQPFQENPTQFNPMDQTAHLLLPWYKPFSWVLMSISSFILAITALYLLSKSSFSKKYLRFKHFKLIYIVVLTLSILFGLIFISLLTTHPLITDPFFISTRLCLVYFISWFILIFTLKIKAIRRFFYWYALDYRMVRSFLFFLLTSYTVLQFGFLIKTTLSLPGFVTRLAASVFLLIFLTGGLCFSLSFSKKHKHHTFIKKHYVLINSLSILFFLCTTCLTILGYLSLSEQITYAAFLSLTVLFFMILMTQGLQKIYNLLTSDTPVKHTLATYFGYKKEDTWFEFLLLKTTLQLIIILSGLFLIAESVGFSTELTNAVYEQFIHGIHLVNTTFYPTRILAGLIAFCLIYLVSRALSTRLSRQQNQEDDEEETQVVIASILIYIGFGLAMITGLFIAGFNFTGLAIVAGALSVGIGLGLQSIVNNFVSGLILLIEKPLKPGDRISVDGVEGFVKKIQVRSTQIITPSREDIIIPNSDLITRRVTNFMYSDKFCRINCNVGVAYGSDTYAVRDTLIEIANAHDEVIKTGKNKPAVLFKTFGDSNLMFELSCLIKDVNKKSFVKSELNYEIERLFRERNIQMAFPQQEIYVRYKAVD